MVTSPRGAPHYHHQRLQFTSPRCTTEDEQPSSSLNNHKDRWQHMSELAGDHKQDGSVLDLRRRIHTTTPATLKVGVPPQVASHIHSLHVCMDDYPLPEWLDVVASLFFQLQHLYTYPSHKMEHTECARMRRLYILYRLPDLVSIDGKAVSPLEQQLARPSSPNGYPVKKEDWVSPDASDDDEETESEASSMLQHGDAVEVSLFGVVKRVNADPPKEEWEEPALPKPYEPKTTHVSTNVTKSVETAYRTATRIRSRSLSAEDVRTCGGRFGLAAAFAENPCVGRGRAALEEPDTVEYTDGQQHNTSTKPLPETTTEKRPERASADNRAERQSSSQEETGTAKRVESRRLPKSPDHKETSEDLSPDRPVTPSSPKETPPRTSPSASLSSPFPMQFRSKSFSGALPSRLRNGHKKENSSPDLSPAAAKKRNTLEKDTIESPPKPSPNNSRLRLRRSHAESRPPPCPGGARRVLPIPQPRWRARKSKESIRSTSIVDDDDSDEEEETSEEELLE